MDLHAKHIARGITVLALGACAGVAALAASVNVQPGKDYTRLGFTFDQPTRLQIGGGQKLVLSFDRPVTQALPKLAVADSVEKSADGKQVTVNLKKNYRVRQFKSGNSVGVDIMNSVAPETKEVPPKIIAPPPIKSKAAEPAPPEIKAAQEAPAPTAIRTAPPSILTTKDTPPVEETPPPTAPPVQEEGPPAPDMPPVAALDATPQDRIAAPAPANPMLTTKATEPEAPPPAAAPAPTDAAPVTEVETAPAAAPAAPKEAAAAPAASVADNSFLVGVKNGKDGTELTFPWKSRVASAVFERGDEIWAVFSRPVDANTAMLKTVLPKSVIKIDQFAYEGATVLRLTTDGSLHASLTQPASSYAQTLKLAPQGANAALDIPLASDKDDDGKPFLLLQAFDVSEPLKFFDPTVGDLLVVVPTYEIGRGVANQKTTPEMTILQTPQGIAIASLRDTLQTAHGRTGVKIYARAPLAVSQNLPVLTPEAAPVPGTSAASTVMIPYDQWYVPPQDFMKTRAERIQLLNDATEDVKPAAMERLMQLYMGQSMMSEALGYLKLMQEEYPQYYTDHKLAMLTAAAELLTGQTAEAQAAINRPEIAPMQEAQLWREAIGLTAPPPPLAAQLSAPAPEPAADGQPALTPASPTPHPQFRYLDFNKPFIRLYPPRIRQKLAIMAADHYLQDGQPDNALAAFETLNSDGILQPVQPYAELMLGMIAEAKDKPKEALRIFDRLAKQPDDRYIQARARYEGLVLRYKRKLLEPADVTEQLERLRMTWRGDGLERQMLNTLVDIYKEQDQYDNVLRTWKYLLQNYPGDVDTLTLAGDMTDTFQDLFLHGKADDMPPLKALGLFYEFRELTPIGENGDAIIQKLADRLAAVDLLDRATQLLEHQIKYRVSGEARARVGARLALLYMLNKQPQRALEVLEITNYGDMPADLQRQRLQLTAQALAENGHPEEGLSLLFHDESPEGGLLRMDILWGMQDWPNIINAGEDLLSARPNLTEPLKENEAQVLLKLALAYSFEGDTTQLRYLRDYYMGLMPEGPYKEIFDYITNDTAKLDAEDFALVAKQISHTESFLDLFKNKIAAGKLSEVAK